MERIVNLERDHKEICTLHVTCFSYLHLLCYDVSR